MSAALGESLRRLRNEKESTVIGCIDNGVSRHVCIDGDGGNAIPLEVLTAFCARAKEWRR